MKEVPKHLIEERNQMMTYLNNKGYSFAHIAKIFRITRQGVRLFFEKRSEELKANNKIYDKN